MPDISTQLKRQMNAAPAELRDYVHALEVMAPMTTELVKENHQQRRVIEDYEYWIEALGHS